MTDTLTATDIPADPGPEEKARQALAALAQADAAVRTYPEPREGPGFIKAQRAWSAAYAVAIGLGSAIHGEVP